MADKKSGSKDSVLTEAKEAFAASVEAEADNRQMWLEDLKFGRLGEQWPAEVLSQRKNRPALTINRMPSFIRQIVNDCRQNKPQIKVKPVDDHADSATADMLSGLVRNIETASNADVAYDTAVDFAVSAGFGYIRVDVEHSYDDSFDKHLAIKRVANPLMVYGDPYSKEADSSDWNTAFIVDHVPKDEFKEKYPKASSTDWEADNEIDAHWMQDGNVLVAEYWKREEYESQLLLLANGEAVKEDVYREHEDIFGGIPVIKARPLKCYRIKHYLMTGAEVLEETPWPGKYIPLIPVYGEEINVEGKRIFRSLIRDAKDAQRMLNYWRTTATELVALAPRVPFLLEEHALDIDPAEIDKWNTANQISHNFLMYKGMVPPQRLPLDSGTAAGAMTEALQASDDMKSIMGMFDASLGQKSNETSGKAIMARQREGDVSTFHFIDNLSRAIRHTGCVLIDMIPKVYTGERIVRVLGEDGTANNAKLGQAPEGQQQQPQKPGAPPDPSRIFDISVGRYDVAVATGPGFTTRREESAMQMTEMIRAFPPAATVLGPHMVKNLDWPNADEISEELKQLNPANQGGIPPEVQQQMQEGMQRLQELEQENQQLKMDQQTDMLKLQIDQEKLEIEKYKAETERMQLGMETDRMAQEGHRFEAEQNMSREDREFKAQSDERKEQAKGVNVNIPENVGESVAHAVAPVIAESVAQAVAQTLANIPPLKVAMPKMKRTPVRDGSGLIQHTIDEPIEDMVN